MVCYNNRKEKKLLWFVSVKVFVLQRFNIKAMKARHRQLQPA